MLLHQRTSPAVNSGDTTIRYCSPLNDTGRNPEPREFSVPGTVPASGCDRVEFNDITAPTAEPLIISAAATSTIIRGRRRSQERQRDDHERRGDASTATRTSSLPNRT